MGQVIVYPPTQGIVGGVPVWDTTYSYSQYFVVSKNNNLYISLTSGNLGNDPVTSPANWSLIGSSNAYITDSTVIAMIIDEASWDDDGNYTGAYTGLIQGNIYVDYNMGLKYEYNGTNLVRNDLNTTSF